MLAAARSYTGSLASLVNLKLSSTPTVSIEATSRLAKVRIWILEMAGKGLHRVKSVVVGYGIRGMTLVLWKKLKFKMSVPGESLANLLVETALHSPVRFKHSECTGTLY